MKSSNSSEMEENTDIIIEIFFETGFLCVTALAVTDSLADEAGLELTRDLTASASPVLGIQGMCHHTQLLLLFLKMRSYTM